MKKVERRPRDNDVEEMSTGSEVDGDAYLTGSSQFSTESEGQSEYEELDEMHEDGERTSTTLVDESMRNATLPMFYDPRNDSTTLPPEGEMVYDSSAYAMLHRLTLTWPALSFDFFQEKEANSPQGAAASGEYPISVHAVVGTQCENDCDNALYALRMYNMYRTYVRDEEAPDMDLNLRNKWEGDDDSDDGSESDIDDEAGFRDPCVESTGIVKVSVGSINRVRHHPHTSMLALWCGNEVQVYSSKQALRSIASPISKFALSQEGFALDWSKTNHNPNLLISGNTAGSLNVFLDVALAGDASSVSTTVPYSIEDVQTSPTQPNIFMAGGTDGIVEVFDLRERLTGKMSWKVTRERKPRKGMKGSFGLDVNAIAWHPMQMTSHLVATGGDDGAVRVWDLRSLRNKGASSPESVLVDISQHHCSSINSIQWSPHNESVCTVCSDSEVSIYDFSLERDFQEEFEMLNISSVDQAPEWLTRIQKGDEEGLGAIPSQLLFEHGGLRFAKEVRMHPSIPGLFGVTHENGLHIFRPCNWQSLMQ